MEAAKPGDKSKTDREWVLVGIGGATLIVTYLLYKRSQQSSTAPASYIPIDLSAGGNPTVGAPPGSPMNPAPPTAPPAPPAPPKKFKGPILAPGPSGGAHI